MADFETVYGDTYYDVQATLQRDGAALSLTGATVELLMRHSTGRLSTFTMTVDDAAAGEVSYDWSDGWPSTGPGTYSVWYRVTHSDSDVEIVPRGRAPYDFLIRDTAL